MVRKLRHILIVVPLMLSFALLAAAQVLRIETPAGNLMRIQKSTFQSTTFDLINETLLAAVTAQ
jgi:hypothetical protein